MPAYKDEAHGTFYASFYYTDFTGTKRKKMKRGFKLKRDALEWERQFLLQKNADPDMRFGDFVSIYRSEKRERIREHTWESKDNIIDTKILPYFKDRTLSEIEPRDVIAWQNTLIGKRTENPIRRRISSPFTASSAPYSTTRSSTTASSRIPLKLPETWARKRTRKCCSGPRRSTCNLHRP